MFWKPEISLFVLIVGQLEQREEDRELRVQGLHDRKGFPFAERMWLNFLPEEDLSCCDFKDP